MNQISEDDDSDCDCLEFDDYYITQNCDIELGNTPDVDDLESYEVECLSEEEVKQFFQSLTNTLCCKVPLEFNYAKTVLYKNNWNLDKALSFIQSGVLNLRSCATVCPQEKEEFTCPVCIDIVVGLEAKSLDCGHKFCTSCWVSHITSRIFQDSNSEILCMEPGCNAHALEHFVLLLPLPSDLIAQYQKILFRNYVSAHPLLEFCVTSGCKVIFKSKERLPKRVECPSCKVTFCFNCGLDYHAPTDCATIKNWLVKCEDDSETANYICTHTKNCPNCHVCMEKNGGCNHMQCFKCKFEFCWMCLGDWHSHGVQYYKCSRYVENPDESTEISNAKEALSRYLHYYERWHNHAKSLKLEQQTLTKIKTRINEKVMEASGTWIDWQYLLDAAALLARCRHTLQYTYPYVYYMKEESRKNLFEYQQAQLEAEIENLSWKIERAETTDRGDLENQMCIAEKRRKTLLKDFFQI